MAKKVYLAVDLGAASSRVMVGIVGIDHQALEKLSDHYREYTLAEASRNGA